jgi:hypothetical protein
MIVAAVYDRRRNEDLAVIDRRYSEAPRYSFVIEYERADC